MAILDQASISVRPTLAYPRYSRSLSTQTSLAKTVSPPLLIENASNRDRLQPTTTPPTSEAEAHLPVGDVALAQRALLGFSNLAPFSAASLSTRPLPLTT